MSKPIRIAILGKFDPAHTTVTAVTDDKNDWDYKIPSQGITPTHVILELKFRGNKKPPVFDDSGEINITITNDTTTPGAILIVPVVYDNY